MLEKNPGCSTRMDCGAVGANEALGFKIGDLDTDPDLEADAARGIFVRILKKRVF
jgi:hypothetical protein